MQITLQTRYPDDTVAYEKAGEWPDAATALSWALANWHPACGPEIATGPHFPTIHTDRPRPRHYLNDRLLVAIDGGEFESVRDVVGRIEAEREQRLAA